MSAVPPGVKFKVEWLPEDEGNLIIAAKVWADTHPRPLHVGDIHFNGNEWLFVRIDRHGKIVTDGLHYIPVDPEAEATFRQEHAAHVADDGTTDATWAIYALRRRLHRDESREMAEIGGRIEARKWWRRGYWEKPEPVTSVLLTDGSPAPVCRDDS